LRQDGGIAIGTGIGSSISEFNAFGLVALEPIELQNYRVLESYIKKKIQESSPPVVSRYVFINR
jgi:hypothetical protein